MGPATRGIALPSSKPGFSSSCCVPPSALYVKRSRSKGTARLKFVLSPTERPKGTKAAGAAVIPVGVKVAYPPSVKGAKGLIWVRAYSPKFPPLTPVSEGLYELKPAVPGIG